MARIGQDEWAIARLKWSVWVKKKCQKGAKNDCATTLHLLCGKKPLQKTINISKNERILKMAKIVQDAWPIAHAK